MLSYYELLSDRHFSGFSEPEVQAILETVLIQLVPLHRQGKAHQKISLQTLQQEGEQTVLLPKDNPNVSGSPSQDIYDLGLVTLELLTGQVPSPRRTNPTWDWNDHCLISDQLNAILERMVTPNPSQRWQNASQVLSAMGVVVPATRYSLKGWQLGLVGAGTTLVVVVGGLGIGSLFIPALRPLLPSAIWSWQIGRESAAMFRGNLERTGVYPPGGPTELTQLVWKFRTEDGIFSSPAVSGGVVYFGSLD
ncbi:PQQ-binding-like beta-propeller repeat protein, partial [Limnospira sp. PMC 917.15]|uniref:PQQ-binding-like beta-propeller repeat protein n=1 Tax=Limnospira sp. PMC 917.15 TaxID=2981106 RepID=UPI0028E181EF